MTIKVSASQISKWRSCKRQYAFEYVEGHYPPSTDKQEFGTAVHKALEQYVSSGAVLDESPEHRVAAQAIGCGVVEPGEVERKFDVPVSSGIELTGFVDLVIPRGKTVRVIDYKTTSDLRYCKTEDDLIDDPQALVYSAWAMLEYEVLEVECVWLYLAASNSGGKRAPKGSRVVRFVNRIDKSFEARMENLLEDVAAIVGVRRRAVLGAELPPTPTACSAYGGCPHKTRCGLSALDQMTAALTA